MYIETKQPNKWIFLFSLNIHNIKHQFQQTKYVHHMNSIKKLTNPNINNKKPLIKILTIFLLIHKDTKPMWNVIMHSRLCKCTVP